MTSHMTGEAFSTNPLIECGTRRSYSVMQNCFLLQFLVTLRTSHSSHILCVSCSLLPMALTVAEIMKTYQDDFLKYMKAEALCVTLALKGVIPEEVETDITRARSTSKATQILFRHLQKQGTEANLRQLCEVASM